MLYGSYFPIDTGPLMDGVYVKKFLFLQQIRKKSLFIISDCFFICKGYFLKFLLPTFGEQLISEKEKRMTKEPEELLKD